MKISKIIILSIIAILFVFIISSCGVQSPSSSSSTISNSSGNVNINAYQSSIHEYILARNAVELLLYGNPVGLKQKQLDILKYYQADIEAGAHDEDYDPPYPTRFGQDPSTNRTPNHFMSAQNNYSALTDMPLNLHSPAKMNAVEWMYNGDIYMFKSAKAEFDVYMRGHSTIGSTYDPELGKIMRKLGHVIHMMQDMTSPPHVRNDNHAFIPGTNISLAGGHSGFEDLGAGYYPDIPALAKQIISINTTLEIKSDGELQAKFKELALFTSTHFFSEDTIPDPNNPLPAQRQFSLPDLQSLGDPSTKPIDTVTGLIYLPNQSAPLVSVLRLIDYDINGNLITTYKYLLDDDLHTIPKYYSSQLMPKAILYSAAVIKYFLSEIEERQPYLYVANSYTNQLTVIDTQTYSVLPYRIPLGITPADIVTNASFSSLYTINFDSRDISVIKTDSNTPSLPINFGMTPFTIAANQKTNKVYVLNADTNNMSDLSSMNLAVIEASTSSVIGNIPLFTTLKNSYNVDGCGRHRMAIDEPLNTAYILNNDFSSWDAFTFISRVNLSANTELPYSIAVSGSFPEAITINPIRREAYIINNFAPGTYSYGNLSIINLSANQETSADIPTYSDGGWPVSIACDPNMAMVYIGNFITYPTYQGSIRVVNIAYHTIVTDITTTGVPFFTYADSKNMKLYVGNVNVTYGVYTDSIDIIDMRTYRIIKTIYLNSGISGITVQ